MSDIKRFQLLAPEVHASLTNSNKQFMNSVRQAMASVREGQTKTLKNEQHKASVKKTRTGVITVDIKPEKSGKGQKLSAAARFSGKVGSAYDMSTNTIGEGESIAALDSDGDGNHEIGSFVYSHSNKYAGNERSQKRLSTIHDDNDNGNVDRMVLKKRATVDAFYSDSIIYDDTHTIQEIYDTNSDGRLDKFSGVYKYDRQGRPVLIDDTHTKSTHDLTAAEALKHVAIDHENDKTAANAPSRELMQAFIRNGGPVSWDERPGRRRK